MEQEKEIADPSKKTNSSPCPTAIYRALAPIVLVLVLVRWGRNKRVLPTRTIEIDSYDLPAIVDPGS
jgi:hypothetical protein